MHYIIYKTTNLVNGKFYIGKHQTNDLNDGYIGSGKLLKRAIKKYGIENFKTEILFKCPTEAHMNLAEKVYVVIDSEVSYNLCPGGRGGFGYINDNPDLFLTDKRLAALSPGSIFNKEKKAIEKWQDSMSKRKDNPDYIDKIKTGIRKYYLTNNGHFHGKCHTEETKIKMREAKLGKTQGELNSQFGTCWITNGADVRKIKKEDVDSWIEIGYHLGRK